MEKLSKAEGLLLQFPHGIKAVDFARKLGVHRTQAYDYLNSLEVRGKARNERGLWFPADKKVKSKLGLFGWLEQRAERKKREELELRARMAARRELIDNVDKLPANKSSQLQYEEYLHKHRKRYGLE